MKGFPSGPRLIVLLGHGLTHTDTHQFPHLAAGHKGTHHVSTLSVCVFEYMFLCTMKRHQKKPKKHFQSILRLNNTFDVLYLIRTLNH